MRMNGTPPDLRLHHCSDGAQWSGFACPKEAVVALKRALLTDKRSMTGPPKSDPKADLLAQANIQTSKSSRKA